jgi:hypothetical protein
MELDSNEKTAPRWAISLARRADDYFLGDSLAGASVAEVAGTRLGLMVCFARVSGEAIRSGSSRVSGEAIRSGSSTVLLTCRFV